MQLQSSIEDEARSDNDEPQGADPTHTHFPILAFEKNSFGEKVFRGVMIPYRQEVKPLGHESATKAEFAYALFGGWDGSAIGDIAGSTCFSRIVYSNPSVVAAGSWHMPSVGNAPIKHNSSLDSSFREMVRPIDVSKYKEQMAYSQSSRPFPCEMVRMYCFCLSSFQILITDICPKMVVPSPRRSMRQ